MRLALQGKTGTIIAKDYRGEDVVAAYTPVPRLGLGLVAKIDVDEIYAPFIKSGITSFSISIIILSGVGFLFFKLAAPISTRIIKSEERYRDLYDNAPDMFVSVDPQNYTILQCNKTLADNLGFSKNELIGKLVFFIYHPDCMDDAKRTFQTFLKTGFIANEELQLKRKDESKIYTILNASAVYDKNGNMRHSRTVMRDICDKKAASYMAWSACLWSWSALRVISCGQKVTPMLAEMLRSRLLM
ncbi:PAS domain S-box protein [Pseudomonadota bacterium]